MSVVVSELLVRPAPPPIDIEREAAHERLSQWRAAFPALDALILSGAAPAGAMRRLGLGHVPEDRHRMGLIMPFEACESAMLGFHDEGCYGDGLLFDRRRIVEDEARKMEAFDIRPRAPLLKTANFSGGNQQKIVLAREIERNPAVILVGQPTRGVDIGAIEFIHRQLIGERDRRRAVLLVSAELSEILGLSDRILVMYEGRILADLPRGEASEETLGLLMAGRAAAS